MEKDVMLYTCFCGKENVTRGHFGRCGEAREQRRIFANKLLLQSEKIISRYKEVYSVNQIVKEIMVDEELCAHQASSYTTRQIVERVLKNEGIYEGTSGENQNKKKHEKASNTMMEKYGVTNWGQTKNGGYVIINSREKVDPQLVKNISEYKKEVSRLTNRAIKTLTPPDYCEYTGIMFRDSETEEPNPNDYRKRSVDHKESVVKCFLLGISAEECASPKNLAFVLKYCNSLKGNMGVEEFTAFAKELRQRMIDEGYNHN